MGSDGAMHSGVMIVAEALGHHEAVQEKALVGPAGFFMGRALSKPRQEWLIEGDACAERTIAGRDRDQFYYANSLACQPSGDSKQQNIIRTKGGRLLWWAEEALAHCAPYLDEAIDRLEPRAIAAFGETAFQRLTGLDLPISAARGYVFRERRNRCWVVPTWHPAFLLRGQQGQTQAFIWDVEKACHIAEHGYAYEEIAGLVDPPLAAWEAFVEDAVQAIQRGIPLAVDIENEYKRKSEMSEEELKAGDDLSYSITDVSFAVGPDRAASVVWQMPYLVGVRRLLHAAMAGPAGATAWNVPHDRPRLAQNLRMDLPRAQWQDSMDAGHVLYNTLRRKLGYFTSLYPLGQHGIAAWKHLGTGSGTYRVYDAACLWRNHQAITRLLHASGQWGVYERVCLGPDPVLDQMSATGLLLDEAKRGRLRTDFAARLGRLEQEMTRAVPRAALNTKVWKTRRAAEQGLALLRERGEVADDAVLEPVAGEHLEQTCEVCGAHPVTKAHSTRKTVEAP